jgi:SAM-dependent methyltransferase
VSEDIQSETMADFSHIDGYVADTVYPSKFHQTFQAPWIDAALALRGIVPPRRIGHARADAAPSAENGAFTLVDLGCGDGIGLILAAAAHPQGQFIGVDAMPDHVARGQAAIDSLGLTNIALHCCGFEDAGHLADGTADYVTAQGVLAWISAENRIAMLDLASRWLKPGGAFCVGYNAFPGWHAVAPFQALVRATALETPGNSTERFNAAMAVMRTTGTVSDGVWDWLDELQDSIAPSYFAHEYLNEHWQPCWSGDVVTALGERGMAYVGQAGNQRLRDDLCFTQDWRDALAGFQSIAAREIAADLLTNCWFRRDLYLKMPGMGFEGDEARAYRMQSWWCLSPGAQPEMAMKSVTLAGEMDFDNAAARAILTALETGPACLAAVAAASGIGAVDILNSVDALWIAERIVPMDPPSAGAGWNAANEGLRALGMTINGRATPHGAVSA